LFRSKVPACLSGETILVGAALHAATRSDQHRRRCTGSCSGCHCRGRHWIHGRPSIWFVPICRYGRYIRLDENRLLIGRYLSSGMETSSCSLGVSLQCYEWLRLCLRAPIACRQVVEAAGRASSASALMQCRNLHYFGNAECNLIGLIATGYALSIFMRRNEASPASTVWYLPGCIGWNLAFWTL